MKSEKIQEKLVYDPEKFESLKQKLRDLDSNIDKKDVVLYHKHKAGFAQLLRGHFRGVDGRDDYSSYAYYYVLARGTTGPDNSIRHEDFPDEYSVERFIERLEEEYS